MIVNELAIAIYEKDIPVTTTIVKQIRAKSLRQNMSTDTVILQAESSNESFKNFYDDERLLGKHFRVSSVENLQLSRHYTICNVMQPKTYNIYLKALQGKDLFDMNCLDASAKDSLSLTIKNYEQPSGLS